MTRLALILIMAIQLLITATASVHAGETQSVPGADGLELAVYETGNPDGPPILFIHGFTQSYLSWLPQLSSHLGDEFRLVAMDLRGHGASGKPLEAGHYTDPALWAEDVAAVIESKSLEHPVLVGWSYGGYVIGDYLRRHGDDALGGLVFVGTSSRIGTEEAQADLGEAFLQHVNGAMSSDLKTRIESTRAFLRLVTEEPMDERTSDFALANAMMVPPEVRRALFSRTVDYDDVLAKIEVPTVVIHGKDDRIVLMRSAEHLADTIPGSELVVYEGAGHAPFLDRPERFNRDLSTFVRGAHAVEGAGSE